ncbi:hypothetical protein RvY_13982 [Ramazzottius varieornatus]|uniref:Protein HGH1 homolog n=1 Tax=Ramazzottius varieornatus TaxID=947166 RepID=A0A1D1VRV3_RAMVA|nr:hypothetical protein RvY_13982 [Ramazzottius varieornatus]
MSLLPMSTSEASPMEPSKAKAESDTLEELVGLLKSLAPKHPLVAVALKSLATATCSTSTLTAVASHLPIATQLLQMLNLDDETPINLSNQQCLLQIIINYSSADRWSEAVFQLTREKMCCLLVHHSDKALLKNYALLDKVFAVLSNLTRKQLDALAVYRPIPEEDLRKFIAMFDSANCDPTKPQLQFFPSLLVNLSALSEFRRLVMDKQRLVLQRLLPFMDMKFSLAVRGAVMRLVRNCVFDPDDHQWLLGPDVSLLAHLLLPLAGPEDFDEEENHKLPIDLQYLPAEKQREPDADLRITLLEALLQLCCTEYGRSFLRDNGAYYILRELHEWEKNAAARIACENVVDPLISDEPDQAHLKDLKQIDIPQDLARKFEDMKRQLAEDS